MKKTPPSQPRWPNTNNYKGLMTYKYLLSGSIHVLLQVALGHNGSHPHEQSSHLRWVLLHEEN